MSYFAIGDIAVIGLAVMGQNLILNMASHGFVVVAYNRTVEKVKHFLDNEAKNTTIIGAVSVQDLVSKLKTPRKIMLLVKAGEAVDDFIEQLVPLLGKGDIIIDGGNSDHKDSQRRFQYLREKNLLFVGVGVSGGEDGARYGPSLMPGGSREAWPHLKDIFQTISAKVDGVPCCDWVGSDGAGHFVKMVHNGIEYGDMQLICEIYAVLLKIGISNEKIASIFEQWNKSELNSFLIEITKDILRFKTPDGQYLISKILDCAGQKGTGKWTVIASLEYGVPVTLISEAVFSRFVSALFDERQKASTLLKHSTEACTLTNPVNEQQVTESLKSALYASKIVSYAQGFMLLKKAAEIHKWQLNYGQIALMWRGGCIIRSQFLGEIKKAFEVNQELENLLFADYFVSEILKHEKGWRNAIKLAIDNAVPVPALTSALAFFDGYRSQKLSANLIQAQRDYFGAHTYQLIDDRFGPPVHTNWTGHGGSVSSTTYQA